MSLIVAICFCLLFVPGTGAVSSASGAGAVVVSGGGRLAMGAALEPGQTIHNTGALPVFVLFSTGRLERVEPGKVLEVPGKAGAGDCFFGPVKEALAGFHSMCGQLEKVLAEKYPESVPPDTVEGALVYPIGAALVEVPDAFKWNLGDNGTTRVRFELTGEQEEKPILERNVQGGKLERSLFESLLQPGTRYHWQVADSGGTFATWFSLLADDRLKALSENLAALDRLEGLDPDSANCRGWLILKVAVLCREKLYYEARAQVRARLSQATARGCREDYGTGPEGLLRQVRRLQRYGHLLQKR
ncbi:MAG: fibronectin type III domain-containing protein [Gemmatimonadota bacterium]|nr:fibronectin type III domain-containing protein [Gemmatimonadota bacterium]